MSEPTKSPNPLPKTAAPAELPGTVHPQYVRCGKPSCRCASSDPADLHGPYHYRFWREVGRLRKAYVPRRDLEATLRACRGRQDAERRRREQSREFDALLRTFKHYAREVEDALTARQQARR